MDMNKFAKENDLARKFEAALQEIEHGKGWMIFKGLEEGECQVKVTYDGSVRFHPVLKPKRVKKEKPEMLGIPIVVDESIPEDIAILRTKDDEIIITNLVDDSLDVVLKEKKESKRSRKKKKDESS